MVTFLSKSKRFIGLVLLTMSLTLFGAVNPAPVRADAIGVADSAVLEAVKAVGSGLSKILDFVQKTLDVINDLKDLLGDEFDELESDVLSAGEADVAATQTQTEALLRAMDVSDNNAVLNAKDQVFAQIAADHTPPANENYLCLKLKIKQALLVLEQFSDVVAMGLMSAAKQGMGPGKNAYGSAGATENMYALCGRIDGVKKMSPLTGPPECQATDATVADGFIMQGIGLTYTMRFPEISQEGDMTVLKPDTSDPAQMRWAAVRDGFYLVMQHPSGPYGKILTTNTGQTALMEYMTQLSLQSNMGAPLAYKIGYNTMMNCKNATGTMSASCKTVEDGCKAIEKIGVKMPEDVSCSKGISFNLMRFYSAAADASNAEPIFQAKSGMRHGEIAMSNNIVGLEILQGVTFSTSMNTAAAIGSIGLAGINFSQSENLKAVAEAELKEKERAYGQNHKEMPEDPSAGKQKVRVEAPNTHKESKGDVMPINDPYSSGAALYPAPAVLSR